MGKDIKKAHVKASDDTDLKNSNSGFRVAVVAAVVAVVAIAVAYFLKPEILLSNSIAKSDKTTTGDVTTMRPVTSKRKRKLSPLKEYEDMFDHSAEIANWDTFRPVANPKLDRLFALYDKNDAAAAKREFLNTLKSDSSFWVRYGAAISADKVAEVGQTNQLLEEAIELYQSFCKLRSDISKMTNIEHETEVAACRRLAERLSFRGWSKQAIELVTDLSERFPNEKSIHHDLGIQLLVTGQNAKAKQLFEMLVDADPADGFANVHLGFILKTIDSDYQRAVPYLISGIRSGQPGVKDGRFYYHLGDALVRLGRSEEADKWYEEGYQNGLFLSPSQRALYSVAGLKAKPWWSPDETGHEAELATLIAHWKEIRQEGLANLDKETGLYKPEDEKLREYGDWKQFTLFMRGSKVASNCNRAPITCGLIERFPDASGCRRGQVKFSVLKPKTHVWPHTGPTNCRLRAHLGLKVPAETYIRVGKETRQWGEGKMFVIDDSIEHEVWNNGTEDRVILIIDFWHPQLSAQQKASLKPI